MTNIMYENSVQDISKWVLQKAQIRAVVINQTNKWEKGANNIPSYIVGDCWNIPGKQFQSVILSKCSLDNRCEVWNISCEYYGLTIKVFKAIKQNLSLYVSVIFEKL